MAKRKIKRVKRKARHVHIPGRETASERQMRTAVQFIMQNPYYTQILKAIRQGVPNSKIAEHFIDRGAFDVNQKTAVGYLQYFRKAQPGLCRPQAIDENSRAATPNDYLDRIFDGNMVIMDEETELLRLIAIQKARLGMGFANEREIQVLMESNRKEVEELRNLVMDLAKLRGLVGNRMDVNLHGYSDNVRDDLKGIQQDEGQRNLIATLVADLASATA